MWLFFSFFFNDTATTEIYTLSLHDALPICGIFDVSHMTIVDIEGKDAKGFLRFLLANDIGLLNQDFDGMYSALLNESGGVIDDLIAYKLPSGYRLVVNCATRESDIEWIDSHKGSMEVTV